MIINILFIPLISSVLKNNNNNKAFFDGFSLPAAATQLLCTESKPYTFIDKTMCKNPNSNPTLQPRCATQFTNKIAFLLVLITGKIIAIITPEYDSLMGMFSVI